MKRVYIAGPYRADCEWAVEVNRRKAEELALWCWKNGLAAFCPHNNTAHFGGALGIGDNVWMEGDKLWIKVSDAVMVLPGYEQSVGTCEEIRFALANEIPVFYWPDGRAGILKFAGL